MEKSSFAVLFLALARFDYFYVENIGLCFYLFVC